jgi:hypothetical protein
MLMEYETFAVDPMLGMNFAKENFLGAFKPAEQDPISKVFDLNERKLTADITHIAKTVSQADDEDDDDLEELEWDEEEDD